MSGPTASDPVCWLDADQIVGLSDGENVETWVDSSGSGNDFTYTTTAPTYQTNELNGLPVVRWAGAAYLDADLTGVFPTAVTLFVIATISSDINYVLYTTGVADEFWRWSGDGNGYIGAFRSARIAAYPSTMPDTGSHLFTITSSASAYIFRKDAVAQASQAAAFSGGTTHRIGDRLAGDLSFNGDIAEVLVYDSVLSADEIDEIEALLDWKWDLGLGLGYTPPVPPSYFPLVTREYPPTRLHVVTTTPSGKHNRWGSDERRPEDIPKDLSFSTVMPGGFEAMDCTLPRKTGTTYQDLDRLSEIKVYGAGGEPAWEGRLEKTPRVSGDERSVSPQAVGWQAHLEDDAGATFLGVDRDLTHWGETSRARQESLQGSYDEVVGPNVAPDAASGIPAVRLTFTPAAGANAAAEGLYDAGAGQTIASIYADWTSSIGAVPGAGYVGVTSTDAHAAEETYGPGTDLIDADPDSGTLTFNPTADYRYGYVYFTATTAHGGDDDHWLNFRRLSVWGNNGLTKRGTAPNDGLYASDVIAYIVGRWCPLLNYTTGADGTIKPSAFIIPQLEFRVATTAAEIVKQANRFSLDDWWVDFDRTFHYAPRDSHGRRWRARVSPAQLEETGPSVDRLWNGVIVTFQDVDGSTKTVGPTGAGTDTTDAVLLDTDPLNPINQMGMTRNTVLDMGIVSLADKATEVGRVFLERSKELDQSGSAQLVGHVEDDHGVLHPSWKVRAGDQITFVDAADTSYRRVVKASYEHDSRTCSVDLDAPPEGLESLLERLAVSQYTAAMPISPTGAGFTSPAPNWVGSGW